MSRILTDIEEGAVVLIHDLGEPTTNPADLPELAVKTAAALAVRLGLEPTQLDAHHVGWLFDLADSVIGAMTDAQTATQTAAETQHPETEVSAPAAAADAAGAGETEVSAPAAPAAETPHPAVSPTLGGQAPPPQPVDSDPDAQHQARIDEAISKATQEWGGSAGQAT